MYEKAHSKTFQLYENIRGKFFEKKNTNCREIVLAKFIFIWFDILYVMQWNSNILEATIEPALKKKLAKLPSFLIQSSNKHKNSPEKHTEVFPAHFLNSLILPEEYLTKSHYHGITKNDTKEHLKIKLIFQTVLQV